mgnify:CR=1 FL=1|jgi:hypothetical protein
MEKKYCYAILEMGVSEDYICQIEVCKINVEDKDKFVEFLGLVHFDLSARLKAWAKEVEIVDEEEWSFSTLQNYRQVIANTLERWRTTAQRPLIGLEGRMANLSKALQIEFSE